MSLCICGNSHVGALYGAWLRRTTLKNAEIPFLPLAGAVMERAPFHEVVDGHVRLTDPEQRDRLQAACGVDHFSADRGWGFVLGTFTHPLVSAPLWQSYAPSALRLPDRQPLSDGLIAEMGRSALASSRAFFADLHQSGVRFFVVSSPPLKPGHSAIADLGILPGIVAHVDASLKHAQADWLRARGIAFVHAPPETLTAAGLLAEAFSQPVTASGRADMHHANIDYGHKMLAALLETAGSQGFLAEQSTP